MPAYGLFRTLVVTALALSAKGAISCGQDGIVCPSEVGRIIHVLLHMNSLCECMQALLYAFLFFLMYTSTNLTRPANYHFAHTQAAIGVTPDKYCSDGRSSWTNMFG
jgi:hypothetical protein